MGSQQAIGFAISIDIQHSSDGTFPRVRLLQDDATDMLLRPIARHVVKYCLIELSTRAFSAEDKHVALEDYILQPMLSPDRIHAVEGSNFWTDSTKDSILPVQGLIACGILRHILSSKRWRVSSGLDPDRIPSTLLAVRIVPRMVRVVPSTPIRKYSYFVRLSHYWGGLSDDQMFHTFEHLSKSD
jgi:hypothetical protein